MKFYLIATVFWIGLLLVIPEVVHTDPYGFGSLWALLYVTIGYAVVMVGIAFFRDRRGPQSSGYRQTSVPAVNKA